MAKSKKDQAAAAEREGIVDQQAAASGKAAGGEAPRHGEEAPTEKDPRQDAIRMAEATRLDDEEAASHGRHRDG